MATAAVAARTTLRRTARRAGATPGMLAFDELGGPLVAVCGLVGGAGTSTLALLLARHAAAASTAPALLTEADPRRAGLAGLTGHTTTCSLADLARHVAAHEPPGSAFAEVEPGLRLVAAAPRRSAPVEVDAIRGLLAEARAAHGLVIVDCATNWTHDSPILAAATHILWSTAATRARLAQADALLRSNVVPPAGRCVEVLVATAHTARPDVRVRTLRQLARDRCERLVLIPHSRAVARGDRTIDEPVAHALTGLAAALRRMP